MSDRLDWAGMAKALGISPDSPAIPMAQARILESLAMRDMLMKTGRGR